MVIDLEKYWFISNGVLHRDYAIAKDRIIYLTWECFNGISISSCLEPFNHYVSWCSTCKLSVVDFIYFNKICLLFELCISSFNWIVDYLTQIIFISSQDRLPLNFFWCKSYLLLNLKVKWTQICTYWIILHEILHAQASALSSNNLLFAQENCNALYAHLDWRQMTKFGCLIQPALLCVKPQADVIFNSWFD